MLKATSLTEKPITAFSFQDKKKEKSVLRIVTIHPSHFSSIKHMNKSSTIIEYTLYHKFSDKYLNELYSHSNYLITTLFSKINKIKYGNLSSHLL